MTTEHVLVVDDEEDIIELVKYNLEQDGFLVSSATDGEEGVRLAAEKKPKLIVLDIMLPGMSGLDVCRKLKTDSSTADIPIIMASARGDEADVVAGLELGADDYLVKPFSPRVLLARVRAVLRRTPFKEGPSNNQKLAVHELEINPGKHEMFLQGKQLDLTSTEFRVLHFLALHPGWVFTRNQIVQGVHGEDYPVTDRSVDVQIAGLRKKLEPCADYIETVRGVGYRFKE